MLIILIIGFSQALILAGLVITKKNKQQPDFFLSALFFLHGFTLFLGYMEIYNRANDFPYPFFISISVPFIMLHGPALWFYIKSITARRFVFKIKYLLHFIPFMLVLLMMSAGLYILPAEQRIEIELSEAFKEEISFPIVMGLILVSTQAYFFWGLNLISNYRKRIKNYFSDISEMDLNWLKIVLISSVIFYGGISLFYFADYIFGFVSYHVLQTTGYAYMALMVLVLAYFGNKQGNIFQSQGILPHPEEVKEQPISMPEEAADADSRFTRELLQCMETSKPYQNPELSLASLAKELGVSPDYLSGILNGKLNRNFFDFVNHYRIEEFKRLCRETQNQNITIMGLAWDAGFNSKATFNRVFKKATGMTPGEFQKAG